ncbi:hypothetical protein SH661x_003068 [Planctomicrobium sp. SH661]|uniref:hypothetical protein n=1 Tax=Planctomicrobium sp. SH661 TaxID=3448124 RepID=UPI003F5B4123
MTHLKYSLTLGLVLSLAACSQSSGPKLYQVEGTILLDGEKLPTGVITFDPADGIAGSYGAEIKDGKYSLHSAPGPKLVSIMSSRVSNKLGPNGKPALDQFLPPKYNTLTELKAEIQPDQKNRTDFDLKLK